MSRLYRWFSDRPLVRAASGLASLHAVTDVAACVAVARISLRVHTVAGAPREARFTLALAVHAVLGRVAGVVAGPAVVSVRREVLAAIAAVDRSAGALTHATRALRPFGAGGVAVAAVLLVGARVETSVRAHDVELGIEQIGIANALTVLAERVRAALGFTVTAVALVEFDVDAPAAAVQCA